MPKKELTIAEVYEKVQEFIRLGNRAAHAAQEESRRQGIPNVYSINGIIYYELPNGELSRTDPYVEKSPSDSTPPGGQK